MRLVEVVMLMGAHCVSPVEHSQMMTDAAKVQCAVVIEKDTDQNTVTVTPPGAASDPQVMAAMQRFRAAPSDPLTGSGTKIVPAWAPAGSSPVETKLPASTAAPQAAPAETVASAAPPPLAPPAETAPSTDSQPADDTAAAPSSEQPDTASTAASAGKKVATLVPPEQKRPAAKAVPARRQQAVAPAPAKPASGCIGDAVPRWYTAADGHRKYRCVTDAPVASTTPTHLY